MDISLELIKAYEDGYKNGKKDGYEDGKKDAIRHGKWVDLDDGVWRCTACGDEFYFEVGTPIMNNGNYCPCCGARMDGDYSV